MNSQKIITLGLAAVAIVCVVLMQALAGSDIADVVCIETSPMLAVRAKAEGKLPVLLRWNGKKWLWAHDRTQAWEDAPGGLFAATQEGWWIAPNQPHFGRSESKWFGLASAVSAWRYEKGQWVGTGPAPQMREP